MYLNNIFKKSPTSQSLRFKERNQIEASNDDLCDKGIKGETVRYYGHRKGVLELG